MKPWQRSRPPGSVGAALSSPKPKPSPYKPLSSVSDSKGYTPARPKPKVSAGATKATNGSDEGPKPPKQAPPHLSGGPRPPRGPPPASLRRPAEPVEPPRAGPTTSRPPKAGGGPTPKTVSWIDDLDTSCVLVEQGFPTSGPVVLHDPDIQEVMSDSSNILYELAEDAYDQLSLHHDTDWSQFPEVAEAVKALGIEELALCVALCPGRAKWGVGVAGNQKKRTQAARLSLCLAVASESTALAEVCQRRPIFGEFYSAAEAVMGGETEKTGPYRNKRNGSKGPPPATQKGSAKKAWKETKPAAEEEEDAPNPYETEEDNPDQEWEADGEPAEEEAEQPEEDQVPEAYEEEAAEEEAAEEAEPEEPEESWEPPPKKPRTAPPASKQVAPHWLFVHDMPPSLQGLPQETLALAAGNWRRKALLEAADEALAAALGEDADEVYCEDDPDGSKFSTVAEAVTEASDLKEPMSVAISPTQELWAVGVGTQGKMRHAAAKVALAAQVLLYQAECGEDLPNLSKLSALADFVEESRLAKE